MKTKPKYYRFKELIVLRIREGIYQPGKLIPSEAEFSAEFKISRNTIRQALKELETEGYLYRQRGKGTIVREINSSTSRKIALFLYDNSDIQHSVTTDMIGGLSSELEKSGYMLDILLSPRSYEDDNLLTLAEKYSGFVIGTNRLDDMTVASLDKLAIPRIFVKNYIPGRKDLSVRIDFRQAGFLAAEHLYRCGCRTLSMVYPGREIPIAAEFFDGVCAAVMEHGLIVKQEHIFETGNYLSDAVAEAGRRFAGMKNRPDGVITAADKTALQLLKIFRENGIRVPEDVMLTGCNDTSELPKMSVPPLTTVALPMREAGQSAARMLLEMLQGKSVESKMLEPRLSVRGTTRSGN